MEAMALLPILLMFVIQLAVFGFAIWFAISLIKAQKERNTVLKDISNKLGDLEIEKKKE
jgi:cytoskeletal protein RodZ